VIFRQARQLKYSGLIERQGLNPVTDTIVFDEVVRRFRHRQFPQLFPRSQAPAWECIQQHRMKEDN
jgi:hypothetical protein